MQPTEDSSVLTWLAGDLDPANLASRSGRAGSVAKCRAFVSSRPGTRQPPPAFEPGDRFWCHAEYLSDSSFQLFGHILTGPREGLQSASGTLHTRELSRQHRTIETLERCELAGRDPCR